MVNGKVAVITGAGGGIGRDFALAHGRRTARRWWSTTSAPRWRARAPTRGPAQKVVDEIKARGGTGGREHRQRRRLGIRQPHRQDRHRHVRAHRLRGQQRRHPARPLLLQHVGRGVEGGDRRAPERLVLRLARRGAVLQEPELGLLRPHDLDLGPDRQPRPGQLLGGQARHRRRCPSRSRSTWRSTRCAPTASRRSPGAA